MGVEMRWMLRSKINRATVTEANVNYTGSIGIDEELVGKAGFMPNGERLETYVIIENGGSGTICMNGPAALVMKKGDFVTIIGFELADAPIKSQKISVDKNNKFVAYL
jgi:aspartate 1-decarboxylase